MENIFEHFMELILPYIISILEIIGIMVVCWTAGKAFWEYIQNTFLHKHYALQSHFATGLATALEFKMAAELLKTLLVKELSELLVLGAVILLRALLSFLIHFEMKHAKEDGMIEEKKESTDSKETVEE